MRNVSTVIILRIYANSAKYGFLVKCIIVLQQSSKDSKINRCSVSICELKIEKYRLQVLDQHKHSQNHVKDRSTVLPAKSDSDVMFSLQSYQGLIIDISLVH